MTVGYKFPSSGVWFRGGMKYEHLVDPVGIEFAGRMDRDQVYPFFDFGFDYSQGISV